MEAAAVVTFIADSFESVTRILRERLAVSEYERTVLGLLEAVAWQAGLSTSDQRALLTRLEKGTSDPLLRKLCDCTGRACFEDVVRRLGFSGDSVSLQVAESIVEQLRSVLFRSTAQPHDVVMREDLQGVRHGQNALSAQVDNLTRRLRLEEIRPIDPAIGNIAALEVQTSFPLLARWSTRLNRALQPYGGSELTRDPLEAYGVLIAEAKDDTRAGQGDLQTEFENVAILCVEREFALAATRLRTVRHRLPSATAEQQVLFNRLEGAIRLTLGDRSGAREAYEHAIALTKAARNGGGGISEPVIRWLERQLEFDLISIDAADLEELDALEQRASRMRSIPAWHRHPAIDSASVSFAACLAKEWARAERTPESTWRSSSLVSEAICDYNRALVLCYLTGDYLAARDVREQLVMCLAPHLVGEGVGLFGLATPELLATSLSSEVEAFLTRHGDACVNKAKWDEIAVRHIGARGPEFEDDSSRTTLAVIECMAPYLSDETIALLNEDFSKRSVDFLAGGFDRLIRGGGHSESRYIDAYAKIFSPSHEQLSALVGALAGHSAPEPFSFWRVLVGYEWRTRDADAAERLVNAILDAKDTSEPGPTLLTLSVLTKIIAAIPDTRPRAVDWLMRLASEDAKAYSPFLLFDDRFPEAEKHVLEWTDLFLKGAIDRLMASDRKRSVQIGGPLWRTASLPFAVQNYREQFSPEVLVAYIRRLLDAAQGPNIPTVDKADAYRAVQGLVSYIDVPDREPVREMLSAHSPLDVQTKTVALKGPWYAPTSDEARMALLRLREHLGLPPSAAELQLLAEALGQPASWRAFAAACEVAEDLIGKRHLPEPGFLSGMVYGMTARIDKDSSLTARALRFLVRIEAHSAELFAALARERLGAVLAKGHNYLVQTVLHEGFASFDCLNADLRAVMVSGAHACLDHAHRDVRRWGSELLRRSGA